MTTLKLYYATNRNHIGERWNPSAYGKKFSDDGMENLRFGIVTLEVDDRKIRDYIDADIKDCGTGDGLGLCEYLSKQAATATINAYEEEIDRDKSEALQKKIKLGSKALYADLLAEMKNSSDALIYIHGFNVTWHAAVGSALALQTILRSKGDASQNVVVILFTWPSDGVALPWTSYKSDRSEARGSGAAVGRGLLKTRDFLATLRDRAAKGGSKLCGQDIHLLCHSMGNYLLQTALPRIADFTPGNVLPRIFEHIFLCAPDVEDSALENNQPLEKIDQLARHVTIYHNRGDAAMVISDYTKGQPERLGGAGAAHPNLLHNKIQQVDCTPVVHGLIEHSYYYIGTIAEDIRASIDGVAQDNAQRHRRQIGIQNNVWAMK
jgi:esterase/lipase superfamily enzyme